MSLLLDELKKSAKDKVKTSGDDMDHDMSDDMNHDMELDLDLVPTDEDKYTQDKEKLDSNNEIIPGELTLENRINQESIHSKAEQINAYISAKNPSVSSIEDEQSLSDLINNSNQFSQREKFKKNTGIVVLVTMLLIAIGLYFYIEIQSSNQVIYRSRSFQNNVPKESINNSRIQNPVTMSAEPQAVSDANKAVDYSKLREHKVIKPVKEKSKAKHTITPEASLEVSKTRKPDIKIIHTKKTDPINILLSEAYISFHKQNYAQSEKIYKQVLAGKSANRDALFGLAAIATKEKRYEFARQKYQYLLRINPKDSMAIAGLSSIEQRINKQHDESRLKFMIRQQPDSAHLYFALGSQYAAQKKWAQAQSAYFSAWSAENKNADYSYNLAVSLDHLDKKKQALNFYNLSLKLKPTSNGNFSQVDVQDRIHTLRKIIQ